MMNKTLTISIVLAITTSFSLAGEMMGYYCSNPKCGFMGRLNFGGGFAFEKVTGYCTTCSNFVSISWRDQPASGVGTNTTAKPTPPQLPPAKLGTVWNQATGHTADLYPCPKCKKPFMVIDGEDLHSVSQKQLLEVFRALTPKAGDDESASKDDAAIMLKKLLKSEMIPCPRCTNTTLNISRAGFYD